MKKNLYKFLITICMIAIGVTAVALIRGYFRQLNDDVNVYSVNFCELVENPGKYNHKLVKTEAIHGGLGIDTPTFLINTGCQGKVEVTCKMGGNSCVQMYSNLRSIQGKGLARIDAVGRFTVDVKAPTILPGEKERRVNLFEIIELKNIEIIK